MAYTNPVEKIVGDPIVKEIFDVYDANFVDIDARLTSLSGGSGVVSFFNDDIIPVNPNEKVYVEVLQDCIITEVAIQLYEKAPATTGSLSIDIKKNTSTNPSGFTSIMSIPPSLNIALASNYQRTTGVINVASQSLTAGNILRFEISSLPFGLQKFRLIVKGAF